jgi:hypothetical protein
MLLGGLTKEMDRAQCWCPRPGVPFQQLSFNGLHIAVNALEEPRWFQASSYSQHPCGFNDTVKKDAEEIADKLAGLNLWDYKDRAEA